MNPPTVSVIMPTYNREALLPRALDSIVAQTFTDWEIILVDDGSTDGTASLAAAYQERLGDRLLYLQQANSGCCGARNRGIDAARGRFIAFLDSDDEFLPKKLERQLALFTLRPELGFVYSDYAYVDTGGRRHESAFETISPLAREVPLQRIAQGLYACRGSLFDVLIRGYFVATIVGMVRREVLGETIRFSRDPSYSAEWLFYLKIAKACRAGVVDEALSLHHHTAGSVTRTDAHRNNVRMRRLLKTIAASFDDLSRGQRKLIHGKLAHTCRQLGYDRYRGGSYAEALGFFAESFHHKPDLRGLCHMVQAGMLSLWTGAPGGGRMDDEMPDMRVRT